VADDLLVRLAAPGRGELLDRPGQELEVAAAQRLDLAVAVAPERLELEGADLQLVEVLGEVGEVVADQAAQPRLGIALRGRDPLLLGQQGAEGALLDLVEQVFLVLELVVHPGQAEAGLAGDVADGRLAEALAGDQRRGGPEQLLELGSGVARPVARLGRDGALRRGGSVLVVALGHSLRFGHVILPCRCSGGP
jgi:hypothetical protein